MKTYYNNLTNLYSVQKTLRFSLKPIGETKKHIDHANLLDEDEERARKYKQAKRIIDEYHKSFIHEELSNFGFDQKDLEGFEKTFNKIKKDKKNETLKKDLAKKQDSLRKEVANKLKNHKKLFQKEFIEKDLPEWLEKNPVDLEEIEEPRKIIEGFKKWTTYFGGFNKNRENIYTPKAMSTSIGYRLIHENLPRFIDNIRRYKKAKKEGVDFLKVEEVHGVELDKVFTLRYFNKCLTQEGIDQYNLIRGGKGKPKSEKEQGINEEINLHAQQLESQLAKAEDEKKKELREKIKSVRSSTLEKLHKQILSDREELSFRLEKIKTDRELCNQIPQLFCVKKNRLIGKLEITDEKSKEKREEDFDVSSALQKVMVCLKDADIKYIYIKNDISLTHISKAIFGSKNWSVLSDALKYYAEHHLFPNPKQNKKRMDDQEKWIRNTSYFSFAETHDALELYFNKFTDEELPREKAASKEINDETEGVTLEMKLKAFSNPLVSYFKALKIKKKNSETNHFEEIDLIANIKDTFKEAKLVFDEYKDIEESKLKSDEEGLKKVKAYLDALMDLQHFLKPLFVKLKKKEEKLAEVLEKDNSFYDEFDRMYQVIEQIIPVYNQSRNYLTQKPYSVEKYKLNFQNSTLADGWDKNKERANTCILLMKEGKYFLAVMNKKHNTVFTNPLSKDGSCYKKIVYKLLPGASKMLPKVFFSGKSIDFYNPGEKILNIRSTASHTKNGTPQKGFSKKDFNKQDMRSMIDFFKMSINGHPEWKNFGFQFSATNSYKDMADFYKEVENQGYKISFADVSEAYINECVKEGKLYLFEIYSKDFSPRSKGRKNLQTLYWQALFDKTNLKDVVYKLNGEAELFFRKKSIDYDNQIWEKGHHANDRKKKQRYPIIKDRRYAKDTYLFHVPITCNFKAGNQPKFNDFFNELLQGNSSVNILGIDRGERHLAYYTLINQHGEIIKDKEGNYLQGSLNNPTGEKDYHHLLDEREKERDKAQKTWWAMEKIKDLKAGYLSQVVHKIAKMMIEYNAVVVFEDLNFGFKRGRFKVEKQVYQKLEKMLIDKLNYLMFKEVKRPKNPGGLLKALQLTAPFTSFRDMGKQTGAIFYVPAYHTSKVCPDTGFVNLLYPRYETIKKSKEFFNRFDSICFNSQKKYFEFAFSDYSKFNSKTEGCKRAWTICTYGKRLENFRNKQKNHQWDTRDVDLTSELKTLFKEAGIDFSKGTDLRDDINKQNDTSFFKGLIRLLRLTLQLRNSHVKSDEDWMISPVAGKGGSFFDLRKADKSMPQNADANGAYHIALKGLWVKKQIDKGEKLIISNKEWYEFIQKKLYKK